MHTATPWAIKKSFNGYVITRVWSSGSYQRARTGWLKTLADAERALVRLNGGAA